MNLLETMSQTLKILTSESECNKAEHPALYSDITHWRFPQAVFESAYLAVNAITVLPFLGLNSDNQERLRNQLSKVAHSKHFEGYWNLVERLARIEPFIPAKVLECLVLEVGSEAFFGNHVKSMKRIYNNMIVTNPYEPDQRPVRKPARKRGYNDKGHLPLKHITPKGRIPKNPVIPFEEIQESPRFYSDSAIGDRSDIAAELVKRPTSPRRKRRRKRRTDYNRTRSSKIFSTQPVTKEEWHRILNYNK